MVEQHKKDIDEHSGIDTTGHEWDGIKELNNPAPRWWLWVFFICCIWAAGYWIIYPAWPTFSGHTIGIAGWTQYTKLADEQAEIKARRGIYEDKIKTASFTEIKEQPDLYAFALAGGKAMFKENCAACHGTGAAGGRGYPNLNDDDWLWGGSVDDIYTTLLYGIRNGHPDARISQMPAFGKDGILNKEEINNLADYIIALQDNKADGHVAKTLFADNCASCHGDAGLGGREFGAPNIADKIALYGNDKQSLVKQLNMPRQGVMPGWADRLPDITIKQISLYVHSLGGGEGMR